MTRFAVSRPCFGKTPGSAPVSLLSFSLVFAVLEADGSNRILSFSQY